MTVWGCQIGEGFASCASTSYSLPHLTIAIVVTAGLTTVLLYYTARLLMRLLLL